MPAQRQYVPAWREQGRESRYPFADGAGLLTASGLAFPADALLDAALWPAAAPGALYLTEVEAEAGRVTLWVGRPGAARLASASFDPADPPGRLAVRDPQGRPAGVFVTDPVALAGLGAWPPGGNSLGEAAEFAATAVRPLAAPALRALVLPTGERLAGEVWLVGEDGVVLREGGPGVLRVDVVGDPLFRRRLCGVADLFAAPGFVRTLSGIAPDGNGNFSITVGPHLAADNILRVVTVDGGLRFEAVGQPAEGVR